MPLKMILVSPRTKKTALKSTISVSSEFEYLNLPSTRQGKDLNLPSTRGKELKVAPPCEIQAHRRHNAKP